MSLCTGRKFSTSKRMAIADSRSDKRGLLLSDAAPLKPMSLHSARIIERCDLCGAEFQYGPVAYFGTYVPEYEVMACNRCYAANWKGWAPDLEERVTRNLKAKGLRIPERNSQGLLPRDGF